MIYLPFELTLLSVHLKSKKRMI